MKLKVYQLSRRDSNSNFEEVIYSTTSLDEANAYKFDWEHSWKLNNKSFIDTGGKHCYNPESKFHFLPSLYEPKLILNDIEVNVPNFQLVNKEYIVCSAYRRLTPSECHKTILKHPDLREEFGKYDDIYDLRLGRHHAEILQMYGKLIDHRTDGFYTSYGRYVDRETALKIALECGQVDPHNLTMGWGLDSSDIFF